jgi:hypothetical protein
VSVWTFLQDHRLVKNLQDVTLFQTQTEHQTMCVRSAPLRSPAPHASPNARHTHPLPIAPDFSLRREEVDSQRFDADLSPEAVAKLTEQERLLHQEAAGKAAQARLKAARAAERAARQGGGASSSSSSAAAGGGGGGSHVASEEDEAEDEEEEEDDDEDYGEADKKGGKRKGAAAKEEDKRIKVQGGVVSTGRKGKGPEDIYTKLLKEKNASELKRLAGVRPFIHELRMIRVRNSGRNWTLRVLSF